MVVLAKIEGMKDGIYMPQGARCVIRTMTVIVKGYAASVQWESPDESLTGTLEFIRSDATAAWEERYAGVPTNNNEWDLALSLWLELHLKLMQMATLYRVLLLTIWKKWPQ